MFVLQYYSRWQETVAELSVTVLCATIFTWHGLFEHLGVFGDKSTIKQIDASIPKYVSFPLT